MNKLVLPTDERARPLSVSKGPVWPSELGTSRQLLHTLIIVASLKQLVARSCESAA